MIAVFDLVNAIFSVLGARDNPFRVAPTYEFWAPWIGKRTRDSNLVINTEFAKLKPAKATLEAAELQVTEDHLREELFKQKVCVLNVYRAYIIFRNSRL